MNLNQWNPAHPSISALAKYVIQASIAADIITLMRSSGESLEDKQRKSERDKNESIRRIMKEFKQKKISLEELLETLPHVF